MTCLQSRAKKHAASDLPCNFWSNPALSPRKIALDDRFAPIAPFPASVTCEKIKGASVRPGQSRPTEKSTGNRLSGYLAAVKQSILGTAAVQRPGVRDMAINLFVSVCVS